MNRAQPTSSPVDFVAFWGAIPEPKAMCSGLTRFFWGFGWRGLTAAGARNYRRRRGGLARGRVSDKSLYLRRGSVSIVAFGKIEGLEVIRFAGRKAGNGQGNSKQFQTHDASSSSRCDSEPVERFSSPLPARAYSYTSNVNRLLPLAGNFIGSYKYRHSVGGTMPKPIIEHSKLLELLSYDPATGVFTWRVDMRTGNGGGRINAHAGDMAGCVVKSASTSYIQIRVHKRLYSAHALAWYYVTGTFPEMVDHRDLDGTNNRLTNLRPCTKSTNAANTRAPKNNTSGVKGVYYDKSRDKWAVEIRCGNTRYRLGRFPTLEKAASVYEAKAIELFGEFARTA